MAINPFVRPTNFDVPHFDMGANIRPDPSTWSNLASIGDSVATYRRNQAAADAIRGALDDKGNLDYEKAAANLAQQPGLAGYAEPFLNAVAKRQQLAQTGAAQSETARHNLAVEEAMRTAKVPFGWNVGAGTATPVPGGPEDPEYIRKLAEIKEKPRQMSMTDITKLSEEGGKFSQLAGFGESFEPRFAGYTVPGLGAVAMKAGRYLPEAAVGKDVSEAASWWQGYDKFKNVVRNELFGASLTPSEQLAFSQSDIDASMTPDQIRKNLAVQKEVVKNGLKRKANAGIAAGYDPKVIAASYGLDLSDLGVDASGKRGTVTPTTPAAPAATGGGVRRYNLETGRIE